MLHASDSDMICYGSKSIMLNKVAVRVCSKYIVIAHLNLICCTRFTKTLLLIKKFLFAYKHNLSTSYVSLLQCETNCAISLGYTGGATDNTAACMDTI